MQEVGSVRNYHRSATMLQYIQDAHVRLPLLVVIGALATLVLSAPSLPVLPVHVEQGKGKGKVTDGLSLLMQPECAVRL